MPSRLRQIELDDKMCQQVSLDVFEPIYPRQVICEQLSQHQAWEKRERRLNMLVIIYLLLSAALWTRLALPRVLERLARPLHVLGLPEASLRVVGSAITYRRQQLGSAPLIGLFAHCCRPLCSQQTPGAYRFGRRLVAIDGTCQDVADTPANAAAFQRPGNQYGPGPFPQIRLLLLSECGSHASFGACVPGRQQAEVSMAYQLLPLLEPNMLLLHDAQFTGLQFWQAIRGRRAHVLAPLPEHHLSHYLRQLSDGSYLALYSPTAAQKRAGIKALLGRVIEYQISDERLGEPGKVYRLVTTLLNPRTAPALELIDCYHERWEVEVELDEIKTHQRLQQPVLRSLKPEGVVQEVYALLLAHYALRALMLQAAQPVQLDPDRLSFSEAVFQVSETTRELAQVHPQEHEILRQFLLERLRLHLLPPRRLRSNPRVLKKLYRKYKRKPHDAVPVPPFDPDDHFLDFVILLI
jgi:Insertion element 4 transposase N-terminal/Transposase DDE domain